MYRPSPGGVSVGHYAITAGTLGCLVTKNNQTYILSNNHVLANSNTAKIGDAIVQPGPLDGGKVTKHVIANLSEFVPIKFGDQLNHVDCAIAKVASPSLVTPLNKVFKTFSSNPVSCRRFQMVKKYGRTTELTRGFVIDCNATIRVNYGTQGAALFQNQIIVQSIVFLPFSQGGDSGSLVLSNFSERPVGLIFAGSITHTIINPIEAVLEALKVKIVV